nr:DHA2 family efflux MFS transporter permease subunit [uncultured Noviherbaspirillum sp.]
MAQTGEQLQARYGERYKWLVLMTVMIGSMAAIMSSTIVNVAVPDLSRHFTLGQERAQWVSTSFMLAMTLSMLTTPWLLLRYGLRRTYGGAMLLLLFGGVAGGFSVNYLMLIAMRVLEGLACGVVQPIPAIMILRSFDKHEQGRAMGLFGFGVVLAPALGPSVGGFLVEHFGWRSIFFIMVPFCVVVLAMAHRYLAANATGGDARPLDWRGLLLAGVSTICLLNGLVEVRQNGLVAAALLGTGLSGLAGFIFYQIKTPDPLMNMTVFRYPQFAMGALVAFIYGMGLFGSTYLLPVYMQLGLHYMPSQAGLVLLPAGAVLAVTIWLGGRLVDRFRPHVLVSIGVALLALSFALMALVKPDTSYIVLMLWAIVGRIGLGLVLPALSLGSMRGVDFALIAQGSSTINFLRQLGGAIGVSLVGIVLEWRLSLYPAGSGAQGLRAFDETFVFIAIISALAVLAAWRIREPQAQS